jgi:hypothetical protein
LPGQNTVEVEFGTDFRLLRRSSLGAESWLVDSRVTTIRRQLWSMLVD